MEFSGTLKYPGAQYDTMVIASHELNRIYASAAHRPGAYDSIEKAIDKELRGKAEVMSRRGERFDSLVLKLGVGFFPSDAARAHARELYTCAGYKVYNRRNGVGGFWISVNPLPDAEWK